MRLALVALSAFILLSAPLPAIAKADGVLYGEFEGITVTEIRVSGNEKTKENYVRREIYQEVGEPLDVETIEQDVVRLTNVGVFSVIKVIPEESEGGVALEYQVTELGDVIPFPTFSYSETIGWSYGAALYAGNAFGRTIKLSGVVLFGAATTYGVNFEHPWVAGERVYLHAIFKHTVADNPYYGFLETSDQVLPRVGTWLGDRGRISGMLGYFAVGSDEDGHTLSEDNRDEMIRGDLSLSYDGRDLHRDPRRGWHLFGELMWSEGVSGTPAGFMTATFDVRRYHPLLWGHPLAVGVLLNLQSGAVGVHIPEYMQYNMGGANSIRGYEPEILGKKLFGKNQLIATVEQRFDLIRITEVVVGGYSFSVGLQAALFVDSGIAWSDADELNWEREKTGFGFGIRPLVPWVDMIRFDVGFNSAGEHVFHLGFGSKFDRQRFRHR